MEVEVMGMEAAVSSDASSQTPLVIQNPERLAVKTVCGADILKNIVQTAEKLKKIDKTLSRYLCQAQMLLTWKRGSGMMKMAGSAAKTIGIVMLVAAPLHPRLAMGMRVAHKLWKLGTGLKILNALANMIRDVWQKGCRDVLLEFTHCAATLTRNLGVFGEVVRDLQTVTPTQHSSSQRQSSPAEVINALRDFIPAHQLPYATHVINMAFGNERYSPLFAFTALTLDLGNNSNIAQVMLEIESFHFDEFVESNESRALVAIGSFLHVSRELCDFLDGLQHLTQRDCHFLQECLQKLAAESVSIMKVVSILTSLDKIRKHLSVNTNETGSPSPSLYANRDVSPPQNSLSTSISDSQASCSKSVEDTQMNAAEPTQENAIHLGTSTTTSHNSTLATANPSQSNRLAEENQCCSIHAGEMSEDCSLQLTNTVSVSNREVIIVAEFKGADCPSEITFEATEQVLDKPTFPDQGTSGETEIMSDCSNPRQTPSNTQTVGLVSRFLMPISSAVGRQTTKFVSKGSNWLPFSFPKRAAENGTEQTEILEPQDQFLEAQNNCLDLTRV